MADTLSERLRGAVCYVSTNAEWPNKLLEEAADEIDRLTKERDEYNRQADGYYDEAAKAFAKAAMLRDALAYLFGASQNEMVSRNLPLEWHPSTAMGRAEAALKASRKYGEEIE